MSRPSLRRFSDEEVISIRTRHAQGARVKDLALAEHCASGILSRIVTGQAYKDVAGPVRDPAPRARRGA